MCLALAEHYRMCALSVEMRVVDHWRSNLGCGVSCQNTMVYDESGSLCPRTCDKTYLTGTCSGEGPGIDGCQCPSDYFWNDETGLCVPKTECFCVHRGHRHVKGETINIECSTCTCIGGSWDCIRNEALCQATCYITGKYLTIFRTFDGFFFENTESCEHMLVETMVNSENSRFHLILGHQCSTRNQACPSYLRLTVMTPENVTYTLTFLQDRSVLYGNINMQLPLFRPPAIMVRNVMNNYLLINTDFGLTVMWNWASDLEIKASASLRNMIWGMCGLFNGAIGDDLTLPTSEITTDVSQFADKWVSSFCWSPQILPTYPNVEGVCRTDAMYHLRAVEHCRQLSGQSFHACHGVVDQQMYEEDCMTLACTSSDIVISLELMTCPAFLAYISECSRAGQVIAWSGYTACDLEVCPEDRVHLHCPHQTQLLCSELHVSQAGIDDSSCYDGCYCPNGKVYDDYTGECVDPDMCPCITRQGKIYQTGEVYNSACETCICQAGNRTCETVNCTVCDYGQQYDPCACDKTCTNLYSLVCLQGQDCQGGCACPHGTVLDQWNGQCVQPSECPCVYGNETYPVNSIINRGDTMCLCKPGAFWECTPIRTEGSCWAFGMSTFNTFDERLFSHNGRCSYVMATDGCTLNSSETFRVVMESLDCGEDAVACTKSLHITFPGVSVDLIRGADPLITPNDSDICTRNIGGTYTMVRYKGIAIQWDGRNMVMITITDDFKGKVCGLCGNFDGRSDDDFLKQQGDTTPDVNEFVDSWATQDCLPARNMAPECLNEIEQVRRPWAESKCDVINSDPFTECHGYVSPTPYYEHCIQDSIKCYRGDDCECLCDALSVYAQKCIEMGVCVDWRTDDLCRTHPPTTQPPFTQPLSTQPTTTQPPSTHPPTSQPPSTQPPSSQPPSTQLPSTQPPSTQPPSTQPSSTHPPTSQQTTTQPPPTQPPTTQAPTTQPPTTQPPTTQPPTTQPPTTHPPKTKPPTTQIPTTQPHSTQQPSPTTVAPCITLGEETCGSEIPGLYVYKTYLPPSTNEPITLTTTQDVSYAGPQGESATEFSTPVRIQELELQVLEDVSTPIGFNIYCRNPDTHAWNAIMESGIPKDFILGSMVPPGLKSGDTLRFHLEMQLPEEVDACKLRFVSPSEFSLPHKFTFFVCVKTEQCVPKQPGCRFNGQFFEYGKLLPGSDPCIDMKCSEDFGIQVNVTQCDLTCTGDLIYHDGQCCPECVPAAASGCAVKYTNRTIQKGSRCRSISPVQLGECAGHCESSVDAMRQTECTCCQVVQTTFISVPMECINRATSRYVPGGFTNVESISQCYCLACEPPVNSY